MTLSVFQDDFEVASVEELRVRLSTRAEGEFGSFWLQHRNGSSMALMVHGADACLHYFPRRRHPGFQARLKEPTDGGLVRFLADNREPVESPRSMVIPTADALRVFEEYFDTGNPSASMQWAEL